LYGDAGRSCLGLPAASSEPIRRHWPAWRRGAVSPAHRSGPFATPVRVTGLANGRATTVAIRDRGPYTRGRNTRGRIIDLSPHSARKIRFNDGVAQVEVVAVAR